MTNEIFVGDAICLRPTDAARRLGIGKTKLFSLIRDGELRARRLGARCTLIPTSEIARLLAAAGA